MSADGARDERRAALEGLRHALHSCEGALYRLPLLEDRDCPLHYSHEALTRGRSHLTRALLHYARLAELYGLSLPAGDLLLLLDGGDDAAR